MSTVLVIDAKKVPIKWDRNTGQFLWKRNNKKVSEKQLNNIVASEQKRFIQKHEKLTRRFVNRNISFEDWQRQELELIKRSHVTITRLAKGGRENTFANDYLTTARELRSLHYPSFLKFATEIKAGNLTEKQILYRSQLYGSATRTTFEEIRKSLYDDPSMGQWQGRRKLGSCADHCQPCRDYAKRGWLDLSDPLLVPIGKQCDCRMNCCCSIEYRQI